jgi:UDP-N-acetylglucosamine 2-epimerase (non-hydrolysing)/UDP-GlcNAc3NAcA epimerase
MRALERVTSEANPDALLVYGDTTTTLAGALTAARLGVPLAHVEAGMRSFDAAMPEERNRILADHLASLCLCSTDTAVDNLAREEVGARLELVGDVMADLTLELAPIARAQSNLRGELELEPGEYVVVTAHRQATVDDPGMLERLVEALEALDYPAAFPVHPRTRARLDAAGLYARLQAISSLRLLEPLGYLDFAALLQEARAVVTDSGGVQRRRTC